MGKSLKLILIFITIQIVIIPETIASRCANGYRTIEQKIERADLIFIGNLKSIKKGSPLKNEFSFQIEELLKNRNKKNKDTVRIYSPNSNMICGASVKMGKKQLVMAKWDERKERYQMWGGDNYSLDKQKYKDNKRYIEELNKAMKILNVSTINWSKTFLIIVAILISSLGILKKIKK